MTTENKTAGCSPAVKGEDFLGRASSIGHYTTTKQRSSPQKFFRGFFSICVPTLLPAGALPASTALTASSLPFRPNARRPA